MEIFSSEQFKCLEQILADSEFEHYGFAHLDNPVSIDVYKSWIENDLHGDMEYLSNHVPAKETPSSYFKAHGAIVIAHKYIPHPMPMESPAFPSLRTALYARGEDYHFWFRQKMSALAELLKQEFPESTFAAHTDSSPIQERDLAYRASLGWFGKNSCLIDPKHGSLFFIGEILTSFKFSQLSKAPVHDHCGTCTKCIEACPTDAILPNKQIDSRKCISYLTIESKQAPPEELRHQMGDWLFGCDICQTVCPWNKKVFKEELELEESRAHSREQQVADIKELLNLSNKALLRKVHGTPLNRAGAKGLKRNAMIVAANQKLTELSKEIKSYSDHEELGQTAQWCLDQFRT